MPGFTKKVSFTKTREVSILKRSGSNLMLHFVISKCGIGTIVKKKITTVNETNDSAIRRKSFSYQEVKLLKHGVRGK